MTDNRRHISLLVSLALGIGAALLVLLGGGRPAAAAPATVGDSQPAPVAQCYARNDSATLLVYSSADSAAVRNAVLAALPNDTVRLAGTCAGVVSQGGTTQTVLINKVLTLVGGYTNADWANSFPLTQPTTLDAQGLGRVITASADITIAELTVQNGNSFGGNGGGIYAVGNLTILGNVNLLSNTALISTTVNGAFTPDTPPPPSGGNGGGAFGDKIFECYAARGISQRCSSDSQSRIEGNSAVSGGGLYGQDLFLQSVTIDHNSASIYADGGGFFAAHSSGFVGDTIIYNVAGIGAGGFVVGGTDIRDSTISNNSASYSGGGLETFSGSVNLIQDVLNSNTAPAGSAVQTIVNNLVLNAILVEHNISGPQGSTLSVNDGSLRMFNSVFTDNTTNGGNEIDIFTGPDAVDNDFLMAYLTFRNTLPGSVGHNYPVDSAVVTTATAISVSGTRLFITDTIISGYTTDLQTRTAPTSTIVGDYNLFAHTPVISGTHITTGTHSLVGNPMFADALGHLSAGSPAIDHGIDVGINVDLDGNHRPSGAGFDIGAYEFQVALLKLFLPLVRR